MSISITNRNKEIVRLTKEGKTPDEIQKALNLRNVHLVEIEIAYLKKEGFLK